MDTLPAQIRPANLDDAAALTALSLQLGYETNVRGVSERLSHLSAAPDQAVFVAEIDGHVIGWVHVFFACYIESERFAEIGGLVVDEHWRCKGVGAQLMHRAEAWTRENGVSLVRLRSNFIRETAHQFYSNLGYSHEKSQKVFNKKLK
ncbi:MAG TPA: GNAT family N-acetyltransferase [Longilinea sp.]|nr:GNAT family N-acetyltransferase [Longilinea sp.]